MKTKLVTIIIRTRIVIMDKLFLVDSYGEPTDINKIYLKDISYAQK